MQQLRLGLVTAPESTRDAQRALARRAVELDPKAANYLNTLGVAQYRAGQSTDAFATLEKSLAAGTGETDALDLFGKNLVLVVHAEEEPSW